MPKKDYRRKVEGGTICDKGHEAWVVQRDCRHFNRDSLSQEQCNYCDSEGFCDYDPEVDK